MLKFNTLLKEYNVDAKEVQLVRHQQVGPEGTTPYSLLTTALHEFERYQEIQGRQIFRGKFIAAFVAAPRNETLFANLYKVETISRNGTKLQCPVSRKNFEPNQTFVYRLSRDARLEDFAQRLTIRWGEGYRSWVQQARRQNKDVIELRKQFEEPRFPGYRAFREQIENIPTLYPNWQSNLSVARGVYLLVCNTSGKQYVGSASGSQGFFGRWLTYAVDGHGGNKLLKELGHKNYAVSILETVGSGATRAEILQLESLWKQKLGSRTDRLGDEFGLNAN